MSVGFDPTYWSTAMIAAQEEDVILELAKRSAATTTAYRVVVGRCLLAIEATRLYCRLGYSGPIHFAVRVLGLQPNEARTLRRVARALEVLPTLSAAAETGRISWSKLREIVSKATLETEGFWLRLAETKDATEIAKLVACTEPGKFPWDQLEPSLPITRLRLNLRAETGEMLERAVQSLSRKLGKAVSAPEVLEHLLIEHFANRPLDSKVIDAARRCSRRGAAAAWNRQSRLVEEAKALAEEVGLWDGGHDLACAALGQHHSLEETLSGRPESAIGEVGSQAPQGLETWGDSSAEHGSSGRQEPAARQPQGDRATAQPSRDQASDLHIPGGIQTSDSARPSRGSASDLAYPRRDQDSEPDPTQASSSDLALASQDQTGDPACPRRNQASDPAHPRRDQDSDLACPRRDQDSEPDPIWSPSSDLTRSSQDQTGDPACPRRDQASDPARPRRDQDSDLACPRRDQDSEPDSIQSPSSDLTRTSQDQTGDPACPRRDQANEPDPVQATSSDLTRPSRDHASDPARPSGDQASDPEPPRNKTLQRPTGDLGAPRVPQGSDAAVKTAESDPVATPLPLFGCPGNDDILLVGNPNDWRNPRLRYNPSARRPTPAQRLELLRRDGHCCRTPGCPHHVWLDFHHILEHSVGGPTSPENIIGLCVRCHINVHLGYLIITGNAETGLTFRDAKGRDLTRSHELQVAGWLDWHFGWTGGEGNFRRRDLIVGEEEVSPASG